MKKTFETVLEEMLNSEEYYGMSFQVRLAAEAAKLLYETKDVLKTNDYLISIIREKKEEHFMSDEMLTSRIESAFLTAKQFFFSWMGETEFNNIVGGV